MTGRWVAVLGCGHHAPTPPRGMPPRVGQWVSCPVAGCRRQAEVTAVRAVPVASLEIVPVGFREAKAFIARHHRHHRPPRGMKFCLGIEADGELVGVATVGRPVGRHLDDGRTLEVNRTATDGTRNVNSMLYGAAWRAAKAMGYRRLITYTQEGESGASLRAAGYRVVAELAPRGSWAESSVKLRHLRAAEGTGGVQRSLWEAAS